MHVYMYLCVYVTYVCIHVSTYIYIRVCMYVRTYVCKYVFMYKASYSSAQFNVDICLCIILESLERFVKKLTSFM